MLVLKTKLYLQINYNSPCLRIFSVSENSQLPKLIIFSFSSVSCTIKEAHYWTARHKSLCLMLSLGKGRETEGNLRYPQILHSHWLLYFCNHSITHLSLVACNNSDAANQDIWGSAFHNTLCLINFYLIVSIICSWCL